MEMRPLLAILASLGASVLVLLTGERHRNLRELWTIGASLAKFVLVLSLLGPVLRGETVECTILRLYPGLDLCLRVDQLGLLFALTASLLWVLTSVYSIGYMRSLAYGEQTRYYACFALALSSTIGIAFAANLLTFYLFYELLTISTYPLVAHLQSPEAIRAGRKYLAYTLGSGTVLLGAIAVTHRLTGTLDFRAGGFLQGSASTEVLRALLVAYMIGCGTKAAIMPLHSWLPSAMVAPTPVSALLHAVAVVKAGVFGCLRVLGFVFGPQLLRELGATMPLGIACGATILAASAFALAADNLKRRLAFSTISQLSYIVLGVVILSPDALRGAALHLIFHAFMKITLFFCAGAIYAETHRENVSQLDGIGRRMPLTMGAFAIGSFGMVGIPPACGYLSKWFLCLGAAEASLPSLFIYLTSALLNAAYFFPIVYAAFFRSEEKGVKEASPLMVGSLVVTAAGTLALGMFPNALGVMELAGGIVREVLP